MDKKLIFIVKSNNEYPHPSDAFHRIFTKTSLNHVKISG